MKQWQQKNKDIKKLKYTFTPMIDFIKIDCNQFKIT